MDFEWRGFKDFHRTLSHEIFLIQGFSYPPHVGLSLGTPLDPRYVLLEVHYDNPTYEEGEFILSIFYIRFFESFVTSVLELK